MRWERNNKKGSSSFVFPVVLLIFICLAFLMFSFYNNFTGHVIEGSSDSSSLNEWLMVGRDLAHTGYYPTSVNMTNFSLLWYATFENYVQSSPAIVNNTIFLSSGSLIYAINISTNGTQLWNYSAKTDILSSSPAIAGKTIYFGDAINTFYALNISDGTHLWNYTSSNSFLSSPLVSNNSVYIGNNNGTFYSFNATDGNLIWTFTSPFASPFEKVAAISGAIIYAPATAFISEPFLYALNINDGTQLWNYSLALMASPTSPTVSKNIVYIGKTDDLFALNATNGTHIWNYSQEDGLSITSSAIKNDIVYFGGGDYLYAVNATNGTLIWKYTHLFYGPDFSEAAPSIANDVVFIGSNTGYQFYAINATDGTEIFVHSRLLGDYSSYPVIVNGTVYVSNQRRIYAFSNAVSSCGVDSWYCEDWSSITCINNVQTRTCNNYNHNCGTYLDWSKTESQSCTSYSSSPSNFGGSGGGGSSSTQHFTELIPEVPIELFINNTKLDLTSINLTLKSSVENGSLTVTRINSTPPLLENKSIEGKVYQTFEVVMGGINLTDILNVTLKFKINKSWLTENNITVHTKGSRYWLIQNDIIGNIQIYRNPNGYNSWLPLQTNFSHEDNFYYYFFSFSPGFSTFVIFFNKYDCMPNTIRCSEKKVQLCLGNATWLETESCSYKCEDGSCLKSPLIPILIYFVVIGAVVIIIIRLAYILFAKIKKK